MFITSRYSNRVKAQQPQQAEASAEKTLYTKRLDNMSDIAITKFKRIKKHPYLRGLAEVKVNGILLRGLRLEAKSSDELTLGFPGRKVQGSWQVVYETGDPQTQSTILRLLKDHYHADQVAA